MMAGIAAKLLFVFAVGSSVNSENKKIETGRDRDFGNNYFYMRYKLLSDSTFETEEYLILANKEEEDKGNLWEKIKYQVNANGMLDTILMKRMIQKQDKFIRLHLPHSKNNKQLKRAYFHIGPFQ